MPNFLDLEGARFSTETKISQHLYFDLEDAQFVNSSSGVEC